MVFGNVSYTPGLPLVNPLTILRRTVTSAQPSGVSRYVDEQFDGAFNISQLNGDLPHVKWGRIDYMNVTALTTKWGVWRSVQ